VKVELILWMHEWIRIIFVLDKSCDKCILESLDGQIIWNPKSCPMLYTWSKIDKSNELVWEIKMCINNDGNVRKLWLA